VGGLGFRYVCVYVCVCMYAWVKGCVKYFLMHACLFYTYMHTYVSNPPPWVLVDACMSLVKKAMLLPPGFRV
jgi:hypothetical protein